ncbi:MAG: VOC family protein [Polyangiaceae bacterium]
MFPFHLAIVVRDLEATRAFYRDVLGCREGRSDTRWVDFDFHGHQITAHLHPGRRPALADDPSQGEIDNPVDGDDVPVPHFGCVLDMATWEATAERFRTLGLSFVIEPRIRFRGRVGEQATLFIRDPDGHAIELKAFADPSQLFAR